MDGWMMSMTGTELDVVVSEKVCVRLVFVQLLCVKVCPCAGSDSILDVAVVNDGVKTTEGHKE